MGLTEGSRKLHKEKLYNLRASPSIIMVVKLGRIRVSGRNVGDNIKNWLNRNSLWKKTWRTSSPGQGQMPSFREYYGGSSGSVIAEFFEQPSGY